MKSFAFGRYSSVRNALVAAAIFVGAPTAAFAAGPLGEMTPELASVEDAQLDNLEIARVQPVVMADQSAELQVSVTFARASKANGANAMDLVQTMQNVEALQAEGEEEGLDFAGSSNKLDIAALQYGFVLGMAPMMSVLEGQDRAEMLQQLEALSSANALFGNTTRQAIEKYVKSAASGKADHAAFMEMMRAASQDIASSGDPSIERRHGYLLVGLWSGLSRLSAEVGQNSRDLAATGDILVQLLEKDAIYGGSDRELAKQVRLVNAELRKDVPSKEVVRAALAEMVKVSQDA
ncbi:MAG: hypothetical protein VYE40_01930 [Myxococcota bacterium]|nr:hypothetical protein [Myxococcota bacterium]